MPLRLFIESAFSTNYHNIQNSVIVTSIIATITHKDPQNSNIPLRCLVEFIFTKNGNFNKLNVDINFNRLIYTNHTLTLKMVHSATDFNINDFESIEISRIFKDIPDTMNKLRQLIIDEYNILHP